MTKPLDPDLKAMRAFLRALAPLSNAEIKRNLEWLLAYVYDRPGFSLPPLRARRPKVPAPTTEREEP